MIKPPVQGPYYPVSTHVRIYRKGPYYSVSGKSIKGPYYPALIYFGNRCGAVPFPTRRWFNQFHVHVAHQNISFIWGGTSRGRLYSTQVYSTQLASPLGKRRRTEEKVTLLAKLVDLTCMFCINTMPVHSPRMIVGRHARPPAVIFDNNTQVLLGFTVPAIKFLSWLPCNQNLLEAGCHVAAHA